MEDKRLQFYFSILFFLLTLALFYFLGFTQINLNRNSLVFSQDELFDYSRPALAEIVVVVKGEASISRISFDESSGIFRVDDEETFSVSFKKFIPSLGFFVNEDGYLVTSSNSFSQDNLKNILGNEYLSEALLVDNIKLTEIIERNETFLFDAKVFLEKAIDIMSFSTEARVLMPSENEGEIDGVFSRGLVARIIPQTGDSNRILILKIDVNTPSLGICDNDSCFGEQTFKLFGKDKFVSGEWFSTRVERQGLSGGRVLPTRGEILNAETFSGAPVLDVFGNATGIIWENTEEISIVLADKIVSVLGSVDIENTESKHISSIKDGIKYLKDRKCKKALKSFETAKKLESYYPIGINSGIYETQCRRLIADGGSLDSFISRMMDKLRKIGFIFYPLMLLTTTALIFVARSARRLSLSVRREKY